MRLLLCVAGPCVPTEVETSERLAISQRERGATLFSRERANPGAGPCVRGATGANERMGAIVRRFVVARGRERGDDRRRTRDRRRGSSSYASASPNRAPSATGGGRMPVFLIDTLRKRVNTSSC
jgi:hypothetical protein